MSMKTQGTQIYMVSTTGSSTEIIRIGCVTGVSYAGSPKDQIENTCLDELIAHTYEPGLENPGVTNFSVDFDTANETHMTVWDQYKSNTTTQWAIGFSNGTSAPTIDSNGDLQVTSDRSWLKFNGYVNDLPLDFALNSLVKSDIPVQITGGVDLSAKAAV